MTLFYVHAGVMATGFFLMVSGAAIAGFLRQKRWWLKAHKAAGMTGSVVLVFGLTAAVVMIEQSGGQHIAAPHAWAGLITILMTMTTLLLGHLQFKIREKAKQLREKHRLSGRITLIAGVLTILSGLRVADLI